jgi:hypothetical protein
MQSRSGELAMRPLPAVLLDLYEELATGRLSLRRGRVAKTVDLVNGNPVSTASTPRDETLGHFLVSSGVITEAAHREAVARAASLGGKLGEALVGLRILSFEQLIEQLGKQARHKLVQALRWPQGAWRFDAANEKVEGIPLRMIDIVLGGLGETAADDPTKLSRLDAMTFELTERGTRLKAELRKAFGGAAVDALAGGASTAQLEQAVGDIVRARGALDAMLMCDAVVGRASAPVGAGSAYTVSRRTLANIPAVRDIVSQYEPQPEVQAEVRGDDGQLYSVLFEDEPGLTAEPSRTDTGERPLDFDNVVVERNFEDSGVVSTHDLVAVKNARARAERAHQAVAAEYQRVQGADHYAVLLIDRDAVADDVEAAYQVKLTLFDRGAAPATSARDRNKAEAVRTAYLRARDTLLDADARAAYNRELAGGELVQGPPAIDTELSFRTAEDAMAKQQWAQAVGLLKTVIARSPGEADYHAALGWALWNVGERSPAAADAARNHLDQALSINPDHPAAHAYKGRVDAALRSDDESATFHLERALALEPARVETIAAIDELLVARGELRQLERVLKRTLFRLRGKGGAAELAGWTRLARLYLEQLDDPAAAAAAIANAKRLAPDDRDVRQLVARAAKLPAQRTGWREALADTSSGAALVRTTAAAGDTDAAFLAASTMVALGTADQALAAQYEQHRASTPRLGEAPLDPDHWTLLRHRDDTIEIGALLERIAPAVHRLAPMTLADSELDAGKQIAESKLPAAFAALRVKLGRLLSVEPCPVYARAELGMQIHVVACDPPVLVAGTDALSAPARPDLVFRLARALTFTWPGRAVGASRPGRVLRALVLAVVRDATGTEIGLDDPLAATAADALATLSTTVRGHARTGVLRLLSRGGDALNLSLWAKALSRTADRAGLLLCGDVPAAFAGAREVGELDNDLVEFAYSAAHVKLRADLGLATGVA